MKNILLLILLLTSFWACKNEPATAAKTETAEVQEKMQNDFDLTPISHATAVFKWNGKIFYIDPVGGAEAFEGQPKPDVILVTDIHGDHLNSETVNAVALPNTKIIVPQAVAEKMEGDAKHQLTMLNNGETLDVGDFSIEAIPMYNLREEALKYHEKGRGNGYIISTNGMRVYFSGDTEDIEEMRNLKNIDKAFVCMNLPYTMPIESAASAVLDFKPKEVYPYHYRGTEGLSDVGKFKKIVNEGNPDIQVVQLNWYPSKE